MIIRRQLDDDRSQKKKKRKKEKTFDCLKIYDKEKNSKLRKPQPLPNPFLIEQTHSSPNYTNTN